MPTDSCPVLQDVIGGQKFRCSFPDDLLQNASILIILLCRYQDCKPTTAALGRCKQLGFATLPLVTRLKNPGGKQS